ncbi:MAG: SDR family NAD(P)-dependent oxidoreductase [Anaerolineaceae bacterium]|nr:MAG: SDR family NAD(P)-dependent oxidoreductase [Anaerolineaceae bacterium]
MQIDNQNIILTGAASGIGLALLKRLAAYDCRIIAVDRDSFDVPQAGRARILPYQADLSQPETVDEIIAYATEQIGGVDIFIANAGFAYYGDFHATSWEQIEAIHRVNVFSPLYTITRMRALNPGREHMVVITASAIAQLPIPGYALYGATKAALNHFTWGYRFEAPPEARLMLVYPIATRTGFFQAANPTTPQLRPSQTADFVAGRIVNGIRHNRKHVRPSSPYQIFYMVGRVFPFIHWIYQFYGLWLLKRWRRRQQA